MKTLRQLLGWFRGAQRDAELSEEIRLHLEARTRERIGGGMPPDEARYATQREFGNVGLIQERVRDQRGGRWLEHLGKDVRHGCRVLRRAPGFALAAIVSLAIGIGANTAMFSIVHAVMLRPLPYPEADRLVTLWSENRRIGIAQQPSSYANIADWRKAARSVTAIAVYDPVMATVTSAEPRRVRALFASPNLAEVLRVAPQLGRMFSDDEAARRAPVAVLSHEAWQQLHGGAVGILGRTLEIDGRPTEIIGVMPPGKDFTADQIELWLPHTTRGLNEAARGVGPWRALARLAPGVALAEAQTELSAIAGRLEREFAAANAGLGIRVVRLAEHLVGRDVRSALLLLLAAVAAVLLIACSNVGNLLLARGLTRQREFALRLSLGATRGRVIAQLLVENAVLGLFAAAVGVGLAWLALAAVRAFAPGDLPRLADVTLDGRMLAFAVMLSLASVGVFGVWPALQATRGDALGRLRGGGRGMTEAPRSRRLRGGLVVAQFALAVLLFAGAGVLLRSFMRLVAVDPGFGVVNVLVASLRLPANRPEPDAIPFAHALVERAAALPGVRAAAVSEEVLLGERAQQTIAVERPASSEGAVVRVTLGSDAITPDFFHAMDVPLRAGRAFTPADRADALPVVIVNETLARLLWPGEDALGRRLRLGPAGPNATPPWATVVGVVGDQRRQRLDRPPIPQVFWPLAQRPSRGLNLVLRTDVAPATLAAAVRQAVRAVDPTVVVSVTTLRQQMDRTIAPRRFHTGLLTGFAAIALVLAGVGIFGLMHYSVARRTQEIGVRTALGASAPQILRGILAEGLTLAAVGVAVGLVGAVAWLRVFAALLFEVSPTDPISLGAAAAALIAIAALACLLPARRASRVDPMVALRCE